MKTSTPSRKKPFTILQMVIDHLQVFGLGSDGRMYRWDTKVAMWKLYKDGL